MKFSATITTAATAIAVILAGAALGLAVTATAAPTGGSSAGHTIKSLQDQGYSVQLNGTAAVPLSQCAVTGVHGLSDSDAAGKRVNPAQFTTAYVDISCPSNN